MAEEEIRARDAREAAERDSVAEKRNEAIARRKAAEYNQELARRREEDHKETQRLLLFIFIIDYITKLICVFLGY